MSKKMYRKGRHILSMDELCQQEFVYWHDKITHVGWFMSWPLRTAWTNIGKEGCIYYAIKEDEW